MYVRKHFWKAHWMLKWIIIIEFFSLVYHTASDIFCGLLCVLKIDLEL